MIRRHQTEREGFFLPIAARVAAWSIYIATDYKIMIFSQ